MNKFVTELCEIDRNATNEIMNLLVNNNLTEIAIDEDYECAGYAFDDDCYTATNVEIVKVEIDNGRLLFTDKGGFNYSVHDFHIGTMPYIHSVVCDMVKNIQLNLEIKK